jgi:hypothetical protein
VKPHDNPIITSPVAVSLGKLRQLKKLSNEIKNTIEVVRESELNDFRSTFQVTSSQGKGGFVKVVSRDLNTATIGRTSLTTDSVNRASGFKVALRRKSNQSASEIEPWGETTELGKLGLSIETIAAQNMTL